jgi:hypothetical protein
MDRLQQLIAFVREEPHDPFNQYALALEYLKHDPAQSESLFTTLMEEHPDYLPTYYPFAQLLAGLRDRLRTERVFQLGIDQARKSNDAKALRELRAAYQDWQDNL